MIGRDDTCILVVNGLQAYRDVGACVAGRYKLLAEYQTPVLLRCLRGCLSPEILQLGCHTIFRFHGFQVQEILQLISCSSPY